MGQLGVQVNWRPPDRGWIKCNTDGAARGNPGRGSWGFCLRNENGDLIAAKAKELTNPASTNTQAEAMAILQAIKYVEEKQFQQILIETDSLLLMNCILKIWEVPWQIIEVVEEIWKRMQNRTFKITHIMREGNQLADHLANLALDEGEVDVESFQELGAKGRGLINNDKLELPYLRIKTCRR
ncbi:uncharacterized protein LOC132624163 [Lycium barbarum]|uniref:uncharacterized protein LOC132624163 n=1 Tax=Lycium barbarum TaxID=112863 RepID=UPI00293F131D|nr:uncharacterized protein LOC132624163 [Lycium barbarum]